MQQSDNFLDYSWNLEKKLKSIRCSKELKKEILIFIKNYRKLYERRPLSYTNNFYRLILQYILDNIKEPDLVDKLKRYNKTL